MLFYIDPAVIYSSNGFNVHPYVAMVHTKDMAAYSDLFWRPLFILELTSEYLENVVLEPGGLTKFAVTLCIYACHFPVVGTLLLTGLAVFFYWIFPLFIMGAVGRRPLAVGFIPSFFILTLCTWYELSYCVFLVPVAGALSLAVLYQRIRFPGMIVTVLSVFGLFWFAWYLTKWGCLLFLIFIIIHELFAGRDRTAVVTVSAFCTAVLLSVIDARVLPLHMHIVWRNFLTMSGLPLVMVCFFPLTAVVYGLFCRLRNVTGNRVKIVGRAVLAGGMIAAAVWLFRSPVNRTTRIVARMIHHVANEEWEAVLHENTTSLFADFPDKADALQAFTIHVVNHALCRTGRMGDKLFAFPQATFSSYDPLLMLKSLSAHSYVNWFAVLDCAMDLGMVNTAEKVAGELMENMGPFPEVLYRRALVQIAKGNREAAAVYLGKLSGMPFHRSGSRRLLRMLHDGDSFAAESKITTMAANKDTVDYFISSTLSSEAVLGYLLQSNGNNKAAYDYLMSWYLLNDRLDRVTSGISFAPSFGYKVSPRYWQEALCLYQSENMGQASGQPSFPGVSGETVERFFNFTREWMKIKNDPDVAEKMQPSFGDSYFYFAMFRFSPGGVQ